MDNKPLGIVENWLRHIKDVYRLHQRELDEIKNEELKANRLVELNVIEQVYDLTKTSIVQNAWLNKKKLAVHGLVYDVKNGILNDLHATVNDSSELPKYYLIDKK